MPQAPQWFESLESVAHVPEQLACPAAHPVAQAFDPPVVDWQTGVPPLHVVPHAPQLVVVARLVVHPVPVLAQSAKPEAH